MDTLTYGLFEVGCLFQCDVYVIHPVVGFVKLFFFFFSTVALSEANGFI